MDSGERNSLLAVADVSRGRRILDIGVGTGRTTWLLRLLSDAYVAVDYTSEMVQICREQHPGVDVREADARDLSEFGDASIELVVFSCNGLDALSHPDRKVALSEIRRVLTTGGHLVFSTLNHDGPLYTETPNDVVRLRSHSPRAFASYLLDTRRRRARLRLMNGRWSRLRGMSEEHGDWGIAPLSAHDFGLLTHYVTPAAERSELEMEGFEVIAMISPRGDEFDPDSAPPLPHFHVIARAR